MEQGSSDESAAGPGLHFEIAVFLFLVNLGESSCSFLIPSNRADVKLKVTQVTVLARITAGTRLAAVFLCCSALGMTGTAACYQRVVPRHLS